MKLKKFTVNAGGKFTPESPVVIDFTQSNFVVVDGDNGVGKTSLLELFLMGCGHLSGSKIVDKLKNKDSDKIDIEHSFVGNDRKNYDLKVTKSTIRLMYEGEVLPEPITKLKEILGVVGTSPMEIKNKSLDDIIRWLVGYSNKNPEEFINSLKKHKDSIKAAQSTRADANRAAKGLINYLSSEEMFNDWEKSEKKYAEEPNISELSKKLTLAGNKSDKFVENQTKTDAQKQRKAQIEQQIKTLQKELEMVDENIAIGEKWLAANETAKKDYDTIKKQYDNAAKDVADYNKWQEIKRKKAELDEFETISQRADSKEKEILKKVKELQAEIIPDMKGVEIVTENTHEDGKQVKEGLYINGLNSVQVSESEWWAFVLMIFRKFKVRIVVIDNMQSLGSKAIEILEKLEKDGCYILAAEMNREQKTLEIDYK